MAFAILISEKGGAERREVFEKTDVTVGRVQGNDLMLPKGNVSKRHARLTFRDGRFVVTDLRSTNGTYVNGRKLVQSSVVRQGDKIYVGDFVLRLEALPGSMLAADSQPPAASATSEESAPPAAEGMHSASSLPPDGASASLERTSALSSSPPSDANAEANAHGTNLRAPVPAPPRLPRGLGPRRAGGTQRLDTFSTPSPFPLEEALPQSPLARVAAAQTATPVVSPVRTASMAPTPVAAAAQAASPVRTAATPSAEGSPAPQQLPQPLPVPLPPVPKSPLLPAPLPPVPHAPVRRPAGTTAAPGAHRALVAQTPHATEAPRQEVVIRSEPTSSSEAYRLALSTLVERIAEAVNLEALRDGAPVDEALAQLIERAIRDEATSLQTQGDIGAGVDLEKLRHNAQNELLGLGPLGPLLEDPAVFEIHITRHDLVQALRANQQTSAEVAFTSEESLRRVIARLCYQAGAPLAPGEHVAERRLTQGVQLSTVLSPVSVHGHVLTLRKRRHAHASLDELVRNGTVSQPLESFFLQCLALRANILIIGSSGEAGTLLLSALVSSAAATKESMVVLQAPDALITTPSHVASLMLEDVNEQGGRIAQVAHKLQSDRLFVGALSGHVALAVLEAISNGASGIAAAIQASSLAHAWPRLVATLCVLRPSLTPESAREWLAASFDIAVQLTRLRDDRYRIVRVAEVGGVDAASRTIALRDIFTFSVDQLTASGAAEGTFHATGIVPRLIQEAHTQGMEIDLAIFDRGSG